MFPYFSFRIADLKYWSALKSLVFRFRLWSLRGWNSLRVDRKLILNIDTNSSSLLSKAEMLSDTRCH